MDNEFKEFGIEVCYLSDRILDSFSEKYPELDDKSSQIIAGSIMMSLFKLAPLLNEQLRFLLCHNIELISKRIRNMDLGDSNVK